MNGKTITERISIKLQDILEKIKDSEEKRTGVRPSTSTASAILANRIERAGGLKA